MVRIKDVKVYFESTEEFEAFIQEMLAKYPKKKSKSLVNIKKIGDSNGDTP
ncbi:MAG: hypothetical protein U9O89_01155 [Thermoproteota archaeon]|nr:hypothetical protein [Thermoproteota archaeon]